MIKTTEIIKAYSLMTILFLVTDAFSQVGIGTINPSAILEVEANAAADGIIINNIAADGDPTLQYQVNGSSIITMGIDDSDADKFKIGSTAITTNTILTFDINRNIGVRTTTPSHMFQMTNGGTNIGANSMADFENSGIDGVSLDAHNTFNTNAYNAIEGITSYSGTGFIPAGVFGLALYDGGGNSPTIGVRGATNEWQGTGVRGSRFNGGGPDTGWGGQFYSDLGYTGFFGVISDERTKMNIKEINGALEIIKQLNPVTYNYDLEKYPNMGLNKEMEYGFISQEVREILPEITREKTFHTNATIQSKPNELLTNESETFIALDYMRIIPILAKAVKEQQTTIETQNSKIERLELDIELLNKKVDKLLINHN